MIEDPNWTRIFYSGEFNRPAYEWESQDVPNTFRRRPKPRAGFVDARRDDGCIPVVTTLKRQP